MWSVEMYQVSNVQREEKKIIFKIDNVSFCPVVKLPHFDGNYILNKLSLANLENGIVFHIEGNGSKYNKNNCW